MSIGTVDPPDPPKSMFYKPGTATSRAITELYKVMELDLPSRHFEDKTFPFMRKLLIL
jgi:hypothetical protein